MTPPRTRRPAGWYPHPEDPTRVRHWTGRSWSGRGRARPGWCLVYEELVPDPSWATPGGENRPLRDRPALGSPAADDPLRHPLLDDPATRGLPTPPEVGDGQRRDRPRREGPLRDGRIEGPTLDRRRPTDRRRRAGYHHDPFALGFLSARAAFGMEPLALDPGGRGGAFRARRPGQTPRRPTGSVSQTGAPPWRQNRGPLALAAGMALLGLLAILVNLGTGTADRSPVALDSAFVHPANTACATALGSYRTQTLLSVPAGPGRGEPQGATATATATATGTATGTAASHHGRASSSGGSAPSRASGSSNAGAPGGPNPGASWPATVTALANRLRRLPLTPNAAPQIAAWLRGWERYAADERAIIRDTSRHDTTRAQAATTAAATQATSADIFAVDNGLAACTLAPPSDRTLEPIP